MGRSSRFFEIIQMLRSADGPLTAHAIAETLEVTKRTVYRDIATLQAMRVPIEGEAGIGYIMRAGFNLPPLMFTEDELEAIVVGLSLIGRTGDAGLLRAATRVTRKIASVIPDDTSPHLDHSPLHVSHWTAIPPSDVDFDQLRQAIGQERKVTFRYIDLDNQRTERTVLPIALVYYVDAVVLAGWCELRGDFRHFRTDRMEDFAVGADTFKGRSGRLRREWHTCEREVATDIATHGASPATRTA